MFLKGITNNKEEHGMIEFFMTFILYFSLLLFFFNFRSSKPLHNCGTALSVSGEKERGKIWSPVLLDQSKGTCHYSNQCVYCMYNSNLKFLLHLCLKLRREKQYFLALPTITVSKLFTNYRKHWRTSRARR